MKTIELLGVGLRLVGVYGIIRSGTYLLTAWASLTSYSANEYGEGYNGWFLMQGAASVFIVLASLFLIKFPATAASWLMPKTESPGRELSQAAKDAQFIGLTLLGFFVLTYAIPEFIQNIYLWWQAKQIPMMEGLVKPKEYFAEVLYSGIQLCIGVALVAQARGITVLVAKLRYGATYS